MGMVWMRRPSTEALKLSQVALLGQEGSSGIILQRSCSAIVLQARSMLSQKAEKREKENSMGVKADGNLKFIIKEDHRSADWSEKMLFDVITSSQSRDVTQISHRST